MLRIGMAALAAAMVLALVPVMAQHNHAAGHNDYRQWSSQKVRDCCNNLDCGSLNDDEWREGPDGPEILIEGQWCPVKQEHFLVRGKSPDGEHAHACVRKGPNVTQPPCDRLLCFVGVPRT